MVVWQNGRVNLETGAPNITNVRPALLVAASHSGAGKTTAVSIMIRAMRDLGLSVQAFKIGPDFIDTAYHAEATGRVAINLDMWMTGAERIKDSFDRFAAEADISVVEAMGALFDGADGTDTGSAAHLAKILRLPVVVVLDVAGMTRTTGAIIDGMHNFDPDLNIAGYLLNRVGSRKHAEMILDPLAPELRKLVIGTIPRRPELAIPERHLGLVTVEENPTPAAERDDAHRSAAADLNLDALLTIAGFRDRKPRKAVTPVTPRPGRTPRPSRARLAVARDAAFCFYYEENLRILEESGFELLPFSATLDSSLPERTDAVYIGGGYPESFAAELAANTSLAEELRRRAAYGLPIYAECGGLMYLGNSITGYDGKRHPMTGVLPLDVAMDPEYLAIRYVEVRTRLASPLGPPGTRLRGQEFHQSRITSAPSLPHLFAVTSSDGETSAAGYVSGGVVASYLHLHFASNQQVAQHFLRAAVAGRFEPR